MRRDATSFEFVANSWMNEPEIKALNWAVDKSLSRRKNWACRDSRSPPLAARHDSSRGAGADWVGRPQRRASDAAPADHALSCKRTGRFATGAPRGIQSRNYPADLPAVRMDVGRAPVFLRQPLRLYPPT